jgi:diacylglycerol kinase (ATP)
MRRVLLIPNLHAARVRPKRLTRVVELLKREGCVVDLRSPESPEDVIRIARQGGGEGFDAVVVYGGDGTMMLAVEGLIGSGVPIGLIPGGTGNLLATNLGISRRPVHAVKVVARGVPRRIDLVRTESEDGVRYFAVAGGAGIDAQIMEDTVGASKRRWGIIAYVLQTLRALRRIKSINYRLRLDGGDPVDVTAVTVLVANCRVVVPPLIHLGTHVELDDGQLDVVALNAKNIFELFGLVWALLRDREDGVRVRRFRARSVALETVAATPVQLDGESSGTTPFSAMIIPGGLHVLVSS